jgi:hypothetical protein
MIGLSIENAGHIIDSQTQTTCSCIEMITIFPVALCFYNLHSCLYTNLIRRMTTIDNQIRTRRETTRLAQQEQHRPAELVGGR